MADISTIMLPNGDTYNLKDTTARENIPTAVSDLTNDSGYQTATEVNSLITAAIGDINSFDIEIVNSLPITDIKDHTIYFVSKTGDAGDVYDEYMYINNTWELIGTTAVDLSGYVPTSRTINNKALSSDITLTASDVGALSDTYTSPQSNWEEDDTTDEAYVLNKPAIRAGEGENSILIGQTEQDEGSAIYTIYLTGDGGATTYSYTTNDTIPSNVTVYGVLYCGQLATESRRTASIESIDLTNNTITISRSFNVSLTNAESIIYYKNHEALGLYSYAEGRMVFAGNEASHAEGNYTKALGHSAHAEGRLATAVGIGSHAEGYNTLAVDYDNGGYSSHAEGRNTIARGRASHAEGFNTIATGNYQHAQGKYNIEDTSSVYADIVGNGTSASVRSNAYTLDWSGNGWYSGKVSAGTVATPANPTEANDLTTKQYVDNAISGITDTDTTYTISMTNNRITLTPSSGTASYIDLPVYNGGVS